MKLSFRSDKVTTIAEYNNVDSRLKGGERFFQYPYGAVDYVAIDVTKGEV